ncbi:hypothetical protein GCM10027451_35010 [Geodermatophilus aquaeductus]|uniref:Uncharacterized protein n=1 Tax=Geodermatophilus aquaeductus TaxID=1564161 RepID=A0A521D1F9_9ACTN|nr:hypothetical protein [Geodermatophilus aquaeductus]SMO64730.1 hypothetical protein SAMN06273567_102770 [Geodermatophilus aquaeductus]
MPTLDEVTAAVRAAWCLETCDPADVADWSEGNRARGQCGPTALVLHDLFGGDLLLAEVLYPDGSRQGVHWWNRLPDGREVDLTLGQFAPTEVVQAPRVVVRPEGLPGYAAEQYLRLRSAVLTRIGELPG